MRPFGEEIYADLIGAPYETRGRGPDGFDCYGLCLEVFRRRGIIVPEFPADLMPGFQHEPELSAYLSTWEECPIEPGAVLIFRDDHLIRHVGIALGESRFLHAAARYRQVVIDRLQEEWRSRHLSTVRLRAPISQD